MKRIRRAGAWAAGRAAISLAVVAALAACGGGGGDDAAAAPEPSATGAATAAGATCGLPDFRASLLARVNQARATGANCGSVGTFEPAAALAWNDALTEAAAAHSQDMAANNYFSHTSLDGRTLTDRVAATGYPVIFLGENIAAGQRTVNSVFDAWMASPGHCANVMRREFTDIGVACVPAPSRSNTFATYWSMELGRGR